MRNCSEVYRFHSGRAQIQKAIDYMGEAKTTSQKQKYYYFKL